MKVNIDLALNALSDNFYILPDSDDFHYSDEKTSGRSYFDPGQRLIYGRGPWVTPLPVSSYSKKPKKKKLLIVGQLLFTDRETALDVIKALAAKEFPITFLTIQAELAHTTLETLQDFAVSSKLLNTTYPSRKNLSENNECAIERFLRKNGENPQDWYIIDHYELSRIVYAAHKFNSNKDLWENFNYEFNFSYLKVFLANYEKETLNKVFSTLQFKNINKLNFDDLNTPGALRHYELLKKFISTLTPGLQTIEFTGASSKEIISIIIQDLSKSSIKIKKLILNSFILEHLNSLIGLSDPILLPAIFNSLKSLELNNCNSFKTLNLETTGLKSLSIKDCGISIIPPNSLEELTTDQSGILCLIEKKSENAFLQSFEEKKSENAFLQSFESAGILLPVIVRQITKLTYYYKDTILLNIAEFISLFKKLQTLHLHINSQEYINLALVKEIPPIKDLILEGDKTLPEVYFKPPAEIVTLSCYNLRLKNFSFNRNKLKILRLSNCILEKPFYIHERIDGFTSFSKNLTNQKFESLEEYLAIHHPQLTVIFENVTITERHYRLIEEKESAIITQINPDEKTPLPKPLTPKLSSYLSSNTSRRLDDRTKTSADKKLTATYAIYQYQDGICAADPVPVNQYRHKIYQQINWDNETGEASLSTKIFGQKQFISEIELESKHGLKKVKSFTQQDLAKLKGTQYFVEIPVAASEQWQALPGLTPYDVISNIALPANTEIRFNKENRQYEILFKPSSAKQDFSLIQYLFTSEPTQSAEEKLENIAIPKKLKEILDNLLNSEDKPLHACGEFLELRSAFKALREQNLQQKLVFCQTILQQYFTRKNFGNKDLTPADPKRSTFEGILIEGTGACRHRAIVFIGLCQYLGLTTRNIENDVHAYIEILDQGIWKKIDLGGHTTQVKQNFSRPLATGLKIADTTKTEESEFKEEKTEVTELKVKEKENKITVPKEQKREVALEEKEADVSESSEWDEYFSPYLADSKGKSTAEVLTYLSQQKNSLLKLEDIQQGRDLYAALAQLDAKKPIYYIESCDDMTGQWKIVVVKNGKLETDRIAPLKELITQTGGMLIINWAGKFTASEMASLMSIMDKDEPKLMGEPIAKNLQLLNLVSAKMELPSRFYSRSSEFIWPEETPRPCFSRHCERQRSNPDPIVEPSSDLDCFAGARNDESVNHHVRAREKKELDPSSARSARGWDDEASRSARGWDDKIIVDLYGDQLGKNKSEQWRTELLGFIDVQGDQYTYVEGALAQALRSKKSRLELIDAPWHDPSFQCFMTRLSVEKRVLINGEHLTIPKDFTFSSQSAPEFKWPTQLIKVKEPEKWQADLKSNDIFYLNHSTFNMLFRQQKIDAAGKIYTLPGWLATHNGKPKQIILTESLSTVEMRRLANALREEPSPGPGGPTSPASGRGEISWVDLTTITQKIPETKAVEFKKRKVKKSTKTITLIPAASAATHPVIPAASAASRAGIQALPISVNTGSQLCSQSSLPGMTSPSSLPGMTSPSPSSLSGMTELSATSALTRLDSPSETKRFLLVEDPSFWAQQLKQPDDLLINIHEDTATGELIESIKETESKDQNQFRFQHQLRAVAEALLAGKNVILYGQLSADLYYTVLEPLLAQQAQLKLFNQEQAIPVLGKLTIISKPLDFVPQLAIQQQTIIQKSGIPWKKYRKTIAAIDVENFEKIKLFYQLAATIPHGQVGTPAKLNLTFQQLQLCLQALREQKSDNPIKAFFHHQYQHNTENYAKLNVMAKALFGQESKTEGVRLTKLESYPNQSEYFWRRLNCLNPNALRKILLADSQDVNQLNQFNLEEIRKQFALWLGLQKTNPEFEIITRNQDRQLKAQLDLETQLAKHNIAVLKGLPGSGKTYTAYRYAKQPGKQCFVGEKNIEHWLAAKVKADDEFVMPAQAGIQTNIRENKEEKGLNPSSARNARGWDDMSGRNPPGRDDMSGRNPRGDPEEAVLILDEFNLKKSGHWDFLLPLLSTEKERKGPIEIFYKGKIYKISQRHKVILTGNPESYPGRYLHENLNTTIYLKSWTRASLQKYILQPLQTAEYKRTLSTPEQKNLERLLDAFIETGRLLSPIATDQLQINLQDPSCPVTNEYLSVRDAKQCFMRYFYHLTEGVSLEQAAYQACMLEWGHRFSSKEVKQFKAKMQAIFKPAISEVNHFKTYKNVSVLLAKLPADLYLSTKQREWLISMHENMELQKTYAHHQDKIDGTPVIKLGTLMEGGSGLGKSRLALALLNAKNYKLISVTQLLAAKEGTDLSQCYIQFSASGNFKQDQQILLRAFDLGCKVILDELNLDPKLERVLNQLLTGKTKQGRSATIPGFYVFACQNSAKHSGSKAASLALYSRFNVLQTDLDKNDLIEIIKDGFQKNKLAEPNEKETTAILTSYYRMQKKYPQAVNMRKFYFGLQKIIDKLASKQVAIEEKEAPLPVLPPHSQARGGKGATVPDASANPVIPAASAAASFSLFANPKQSISSLTNETKSDSDSLSKFSLSGERKSMSEVESPKLNIPQQYQILYGELKRYHQQRTAEDTYLHWYSCLFLAYSRQEKLAVTEYLMQLIQNQIPNNPLTRRQKNGIFQGRLGEALKPHQTQINQLLSDEKNQIIYSR